ncbi:erythromycin esterase family protein [Corallococcus sp. bb12-1]|uniref:erythromycin esterase family protein n=1 Tax=Corallococcus sp. bb12-1 TaxID=2996784 RepID=UPI00226F0FD7|nr:erythromycin esterase family protein [Corallococcus sp. bb12-1]MCY1042767.1 erythromycin esterase family protein [Corallococcus sp. bb12-1]
MRPTPGEEKKGPDTLSPSRGATAPETVAVSDTDRLVRGLCDKRIALLGEDSHHGSGSTHAFKAELTRRLVEECQYDAFFIESGTYDFLHIQSGVEEGQPVTNGVLAAAIGGFWANEETAPLISFLSERINAGTLVAGGIDDQLNRGTYASRQMTRDLMSFLEGPRQAECTEKTERHVSWKYDDASLLTVESLKFILGCWKEVESVLSRPGAAATARAGRQLQMVRNLERNFIRQVYRMSLTPEQNKGGWDLKDFNTRDHSMFMNLEWLLAQSPKPRKAIVWLATLHAAKDLKGLGTNHRNRVQFGAHVQEKFGSQSFALGFSALSGRYALGPSDRTHTLAPARADSLEAWAFSNHTSDTRYLDGSQLRDLGARVARPLDYSWMTASWATVLDGLLIFREEALPHRVPW